MEQTMEPVAQTTPAQSFKFSLYEFFTKSLNHRLYFIKKAIPLQEPPSLLLTQKGY